MRNINKVLIIPYLLWMLLFIIIPVILLVYFSFTDLNGHFSFTNYEQILSLKYLKMMWDSIFYALITIITLLISYPVLTLFVHQKSKYVVTHFNYSYVDKPFTKTYAFIGILSHEGLINKFLNFIHLPG